MATYNDKKKMIEENQDLYISQYDKSLNHNALSGIIEQKKKYKEAEKRGDTKAMSDANDKANTIRMTNGNYDGGKDGSEYNTYSENYEIRNNKGYESPYKKVKSRILSRISDMDDFSYDYERDPVFKAYYSLYQKLGDDAYERALSENALRTGGVVSSSAISAAMGAKNHYNSMISEKVPELYRDAYSRYKDEYERLYDRLEIISDLDDSEYSRYRDEMKDFESDRDYFYEKQKDSLDRLFDSYKFDSDMEYSINKDNSEMEYTKERDKVQDSQWEKEFEETSSKNNLTGIVNLAKALYGKTPISSSVINYLYSLIK